MTRISLLGFAFLFISKVCFAGPVTVTVDFWDSAPHVYDGHIVLSGESDSDGQVFNVTDGFIFVGGSQYDFNLTRFAYTDLRNTSNWDWMTATLEGDYINAAGLALSAWVHLEGPATIFFNEGILGRHGDSFAYVTLPVETKWVAARLTAVPEPSTSALLVLGLIGLRWSRKRKLLNKFAN